MIIIDNIYLYLKDEQKIIYKIAKKEGERAFLKGINYRKEIVVPCEEVIPVDNCIYTKEEQTVLNYKQRSLNYFNQRAKGCLLGTVLHIDADKEYLNKCVKLYENVGVYCYPILSLEENLENCIEKLKLDFCPDVVVLTGHDYFKGENKKDLKSYKNSKYFIRAVREMKKKFPNVVIIAGACQSNFEALIASGAHFASSPQRINVHVYDPAIIAIYVCITSFKKVVDFDGMKKYIQEIEGAYGGVEVFGKMKKMY